MIIEESYSKPYMQSLTLSGNMVSQPIANAPFLVNTPVYDVWFDLSGTPIIKNTVSDFYPVENNSVFWRDDTAELSATVDIINSNQFDYDKYINLSGDSYLSCSGDIVNQIALIDIDYSLDGAVWETFSGSSPLSAMYSIDGSTFYLGKDGSSYFNNNISSVKWTLAGGELVEFFPINEGRGDTIYGVSGLTQMVSNTYLNWGNRATQDDTGDWSDVVERRPFIGGQYYNTLSGAYIPAKLHGISNGEYVWDMVDVLGGSLPEEEQDRRIAYETLAGYAFKNQTVLDYDSVTSGYVLQPIKTLNMDTYHTLDGIASKYPTYNTSGSEDTNVSVFEIFNGDQIQCYYNVDGSGNVSTFTFESDLETRIITGNDVSTVLTSSQHTYQIIFIDIDKGKFQITYT